MSDLLEMIKNEHPDVAQRLHEAGLCNNSDIQLLTREELRQLLPEKKDLKLRRTIFDIIHKQDWQIVMNNIQSFLETYCREAKIQNQPNQESASDVIKPQDDNCPQGALDLLEEIRKANSEAAEVLEGESLCSDSDIQSLTLEELLELFPGLEKFQLRRRIFEMIKKRMPVEQLETVRNNNEELVETLTLKDMKTQIMNLFDTQIDFLEKDQQPQPDQKSATCDPVKPNHGPTQGAPVSFLVVNEMEGDLNYQMVVTGETFDAHDQLMEKVKREVQDQFDLVQSNSDDFDVTIVFCPIVSRMGPDVESALRHVKADKPVILVLMHHAYEAKFIPSWNPGRDGANVQLQVNVFFHETKSGLIQCEENQAAVREMKKKLQDFTISNAPVVAARNSRKSIKRKKSSDASGSNSISKLFEGFTQLFS
ncbi:uncharacterized protein LOC134876940 isoform X2 [Eleginops maclovinus]|uniref:uncharacterized protein LOC134876940 isoform X2 n=1 Tax=Eleginops maclovinus TaxID=56733 RepID=UPI00307FD501